MTEENRLLVVFWSMSLGAALAGMTMAYIVCNRALFLYEAFWFVVSAAAIREYIKH